MRRQKQTAKERFRIHPDIVFEPCCNPIKVPANDLYAWEEIVRAGLMMAYDTMFEIIDVCDQDTTMFQLDRQLKDNWIDGYFDFCTLAPVLDTTRTELLLAQISEQSCPSISLDWKQAYILIYLFESIAEMSGDQLEHIANKYLYILCFNRRLITKQIYMQQLVKMHRKKHYDNAEASLYAQMKKMHTTDKEEGFTIPIRDNVVPFARRNNKYPNHMSVYTIFLPVKDVQLLFDWLEVLISEEEKLSILGKTIYDNSDITQTINSIKKQLDILLMDRNIYRPTRLQLNLHVLELPYFLWWINRLGWEMNNEGGSIEIVEFTYYMEKAIIPMIKPNENVLHMFLAKSARERAQDLYDAWHHRNIN